MIYAAYARDEVTHLPLAWNLRTFHNRIFPEVSLVAWDHGCGHSLPSTLSALSPSRRYKSPMPLPESRDLVAGTAQSSEIVQATRARPSDSEVGPVSGEHAKDWRCVRRAPV